MDIYCAFNVLRSHEKEDNIGVEAAKLDGIYDDWIKYIINKTCSDKRELSDKNFILMDNYDGAEHRKMKNNKTGIVSFSFQIFKATTIKETEMLPADSLNILTW